MFDHQGGPEKANILSDRRPGLGATEEAVCYPSFGEVGTYNELASAVACEDLLERHCDDRGVGM
jgi:hypothetical protein